MSHYNNSSSAGSWQNQKNTNTAGSFGQHDQSNATLTGLYNNPSAASLLAQFSALNPLNINNLAANLPALVAAQQLQQQQTPSSTGYQWHSQNRLTQQSNNSSNVQTTPANSTFLLGPGGTMSNLSNTNTNGNSKNNQSAYNKNQTNNSSNNSNNYNNNNNSSKNSSYSNQSTNNQRDRQNVVNSNQQTNRYSNSSSQSTNNNTPTTATLSNTVSSALQAALPAVASNPLITQAILSQLAVQTNTANANNLVAALAAAASQQQQQQKQNSQTPASNRQVVRRSRTRSRTRSRSRSRSHTSSNRSNRNQNNRLDSTHRDTRPRKTSRSRSPLSSTSKRLSYSSSTSTSTSKPISTTSSTKETPNAKEPAKDLKEKEKEPIKEVHNKPHYSSSSSSSSSRYTIKVPKYPLDTSLNNVTSLRNKYGSLYVPSDFTNSKSSWTNSLPMNKPLKFNSRCLFHIMNKEAYSINKNTAVYEPADADHRWTVKVMLLSMPNLDELYKRCCSFAEDSKENRYEHPSKVIQFLVGSKGKHELMALGGPWSPSLDGPNPATNTQTLINTAIRTVKALTAIDLSTCTQWFRFLDIQYNRNEDYKPSVTKTTNTTNTTTTTNGSNEQENQQQQEEILSLNDDRDVETTVIFLPNVWSLMPTSIEYQKLVEAYKSLVDNPPGWLAEPEPDTTELLDTKSTAETEIKLEEEQVKCEPQQSNLESNDNNNTEAAEQEQNSSDTISSPAKQLLKTKAENQDGNDVLDSCSNITINSLIQSANQSEPTHYSKLDLKKMKVDELRAELLARNLDTKGLKQQLINRLKDALEAEQKKDGVDAANDSKDSSCIEDSIIINEPLQNLIADEDLMQMESNDCKKSSEDQSSNTANTTEQNEKSDNKSNEFAAPTTIPSRTLTRYEKEKLYRLPNSPHIIVHPSPTAKQNKFECQLVSLSHLLDYRKDDNKECSFEVFLFAECFNDMLLRDFGFLIYKHLLSLKEEQIIDSKNLNNGVKRKLPEEESSETKKSKTNETDTISESKPKLKTLYPEILLSFTYLDSNRTNYLYEKDLEDFLLSIGLNLSRSKVKALSKKLTIRDGLFNYRSLTDKSTSSNQLNFKLPSDDSIVKNIISFDSYLNRISSKQQNVSNEAGLIVEVNGSAVDVVNTLKKLEKSETCLQKLDIKYKDSLDEIDRLKSQNKSSDRQKQKLSDELNDVKKKLREQQRTNKDIDDKYLRLKDCVYRTKSQLNRVLDDISDTTKRNQPPAPKSTKTESTTSKTNSTEVTNGSGQGQTQVQEKQVVEEVNQNENVQEEQENNEPEADLNSKDENSNENSNENEIILEQEEQANTEMEN